MAAQVLAPTIRGRLVSIGSTVYGRSSPAWDEPSLSDGAGDCPFDDIQMPRRRRRVATPHASCAAPPLLGFDQKGCPAEGSIEHKVSFERRMCCLPRNQAPAPKRRQTKPTEHQLSSAANCLVASRCIEEMGGAELRT